MEEKGKNSQVENTSFIDPRLCGTPKERRDLGNGIGDVHPMGNRRIDQKDIHTGESYRKRHTSGTFNGV
jgi:hypothetical protein